MMNQEELREATRSMCNRTVKLNREGDYLTEDEKEQLRAMFDLGVGLSEIAIRLQRTEPAVNQQAERLDLYKREANPKRRKPEPKQSVCLCDSCELGRTACPRRSACLFMQEGA